MTGPDVYPETQRRWAEQRELMRIAAARTVDLAEHGHAVDAEHLQWARQFVRNVPALRAPLGTGEPNQHEIHA